MTTPDARKARLFFGLPVDAALAEHETTLVPALVQEAQGRPVPAHNLHATLAFLGSVPIGSIGELTGIGAALPRTMLQLTLDCVGSFRAARVAWLGMTRVPAALAALHAALRARLAAAGMRVEDRPYQPHVTIARHCARMLQPRGITPIAWPVRRIVLYESVTAPDGPVYTPRAAWALA